MTLGRSARVHILFTCLCCFLAHGTCLTATQSNGKIQKENLPPIVLVPGDGGSQLEAKIDREPGASGIPGCSDSRDWFRLWMNVHELLPENLACWSSYMLLEYNQRTKTSQSPRGIITRTPGFGNTRTIEYIDPSWTAWSLGNAGAYFAPLVNQLLSWGYEREKTLRGAPYDFRYAPHSLPAYFSNLKTLIEETYSANQRKKVILISHSQGGLFAMYFLRKQSQAWKDRYIQSFVAVSTPWAGSALMLNVFTSGYNKGVSLIDPLTIREEQRSSETATLLLPTPPAWTLNEVLISTPNKNYTIGSYDEWFDDINFPVGKEMLWNVQTEEYAQEQPGVDMYCWHGSGLDTPDSIVYDEGFPDAQPIHATQVDGDGTVSSQSLHACQRFMNNAQYVNSLRQFDGAEHLDILRNDDFFRDLKELIIEKYASSGNREEQGTSSIWSFFRFLWD